MPSEVLLNILTFFYRDQFKFARSAFLPGYGYKASKTSNLFEIFRFFRKTPLDPCHRRHESVHRWAKANNPYMDSFNPNEKTSYLQYLDANNLYGWAMSQPIPTGGFKWAKVKPE